MITTTTSDRIGILTLNRPEKRNALSADMVSHIKNGLNQLLEDDKVKVIILKAKGEAFCAGADLAYLKELRNNSFEENLADSQHLRGLFQMIYDSPKMVIAQVEGPAIAGGAGLASICDFVFAVPEMKMAYTEVRIGFVPALVMVFLLRKIGEGRARHLLLSGEMIDAEKALKWGIINDIIDKNEIDNKVMEFASKLVNKNAGSSMAMTKAMIAKISGMNLNEALDFAAAQNAKARENEDCKKGISAFLNKEKISW
ncbi:enoyl-CoA hydratase/isomerase family protein [Hyphobacterium sp. CCMP332]|nr:enoyl-CoA hydratase/isomerase family protein [Hyphobacterium sp. CCMP332]